jgi:hypothetical protein
MVLGVVEGLGLDMVAGKDTTHPSLQKINSEIPKLDEIPKKKHKKERKGTQPNTKEN